jgi:hypothetical protein
MTAERFQDWLIEMRMARLAKSDADCARLLGVAANTIVHWKEKGTQDRRTDLACRALLHRWSLTNDRLSDLVERTRRLGGGVSR